MTLFTTLALCLCLQAQPEPPALLGPKVPDRPSLVRSDMQGRFQRLESRPEEAALALLALDPDTRDKARSVIEDRDAALRRHLVDNIDLVKDSTDALRSGNNEAIQRLGRELHSRFDPDRARDPLAAPLAKVLSPEEHQQLMRLVNDYWKAWIDAESAAAPRQKREDIEARLTFQLFQQEVTRAYQSTLRPFQQKLEAIYTAVDPTPEQRAAIRKAVIDYIRESKLEPSPALRLRLAEEVYNALDHDRRIKLFALGLAAL